MGLIRKIVNWLVFISFVFILIGITYIIYNWANFNYNKTNISKTLPLDRDSKIAVFKPDTKVLPKIRLQRFLFKETYKYPFYSPQYYSDDFFVDLRFTDSLIFVIDDKDTVRWGDLYVIDTVPLRIKGYNYSGALFVTYYQDTLFQSNIEHKPVVSIFKQLSLGPLKLD